MHTPALHDSIKSFWCKGRGGTGSDEDPDLMEQTLVLLGRAPAAPALRIGHFLTFTQDGHVQRRRIGSGSLTIGRVAPCNVVVPAPQISRRHCGIELEGTWATVSDLGSANGRFLGGTRVNGRMRLRNGSQISLEPVDAFIFRYERRDEREAEDEHRLADELRRMLEYQAVRAAARPEPLEDDLSAPVLRFE